MASVNLHLQALTWFSSSRALHTWSRCGMTLLANIFCPWKSKQRPRTSQSFLHTFRIRGANDTARGDSYPAHLAAHGVRTSQTEAGASVLYWRSQWKNSGSAANRTLNRQYPRRMEDKATEGHASDIMAFLKSIGYIIANGTKMYPDSWKNTFFRGGKPPHWTTFACTRIHRTSLHPFRFYAVSTRRTMCR